MNRFCSQIYLLTGIGKGAQFDRLEEKFEQSSRRLEAGCPTAQLIPTTAVFANA